MARRKTPRRPRYKTKSPKRIRRVSRVGREPTSVTKPTSPVVKAVRSITSLLPGTAGKVVNSLADFVFRGFGLISNHRENGSRVEGTVHFTGVSNGLYIKPADLIAYSDRAIRSEAANITSGASMTSNIAGVRVLHVSARLSNTAQASGRRGNWVACLVWFSSSKDEAMWKDKALTYRDICDLPGAKATSCCQDITVSGRPPNDSYSQQSMSISSNFAILYVAFECLGRSSYSEFTSEDFGVTSSLTGAFRVVEWMPNNMGMTASYKMNSTLAENSIIVDDVARKRFHIASTTCTKSADGMSCKVEGTFKEVHAVLPSLDAMALD